MSDAHIETVGELIERLKQFDDAAPVRALWDTMTGWLVCRVEVLDGTVILDVGSGGGDWETVLADRPHVFQPYEHDPAICRVCDQTQDYQPYRNRAHHIEK